MNELERLLVAAVEDASERPALAAVILESEVYVFGSLDQPAVGGVVSAGTPIKVVSWTDTDGPITPFFTSEAALRRTLAARSLTEKRFLRVSCRDLFEWLEGQRLVLNPDGPGGKIYLPGEIGAMLAGNEPGVAEAVPSQGKVITGSAARVPPELPRVLTRFLQQRPAVEAAHLGWIVHVERQEQGYLMVVLTSDREAAMVGFGAVQISEFTEGHNLDVSIVPPGSTDHMLASVPAFYTRQIRSGAAMPQRHRLLGLGSANRLRKGR